MPENCDTGVAIGPPTSDQALARMRAKRDFSSDQLAALRRRLRLAAESAARAAPGLPPTFGRHASDWTKRHESAFQQRLSELAGEARNEIAALEAKLKRQNAAITAHHLRKSTAKEPVR